MGLREDIAEVLQDIGTEIRIHKNSGEIYSGEYLDYEVNIRTSNPFHREAFLEAEFPYNTNADEGDVVEFVESGRKNIVMSKTPEIFENAIVGYNTSIYKVNVSGELLRPQSVTDGQYRTHEQFYPIKDPCYALLTNSMYDSYVSTRDDFATYGIIQMFLYVSHDVGITSNDRYVPVSGEQGYRVGVVREFVYERTDMATLHEDNR